MKRGYQKNERIAGSTRPWKETSEPSQDHDKAKQVQDKLTEELKELRGWGGGALGRDKNEVGSQKDVKPYMQRINMRTQLIKGFGLRSIHIPTLS